MDIHEPFDRRLRRLRRDRAFARWADHGFLQHHIAAELVDRLDGVTRDFSRALILGHGGGALRKALADRSIATVTLDAGLRFATAEGGVQGDEDRLPFRDASFDLVLSPGTLDTVNDLPGALALIRRCLRPDGLLLAGFIGAGSLPVLRRAMLDADMARGGARARIHPQIDVRAAGDLLARAGFALPVADGERLAVRYAHFSRLIADLRGSANTNLLGAAPLSRSAFASASASFEAAAESGRTTEIFDIVYMTGWSPSPDQPKAAPRGSGTASLADALRPKA